LGSVNIGTLLQELTAHLSVLLELPSSSPNGSKDEVNEQVEG